MGPNCFKCLKIKIAIKLVNQINKICGLNHNQNLDNVYFMSIIIIQPKLTANSRAMKY